MHLKTLANQYFFIYDTVAVMKWTVFTTGVTDTVVAENVPSNCSRLLATTPPQLKHKSEF